MDFELSEEQRAFQDMARGFADQELAPHAAAWDEHCTFPVATLRAAAAQGFAGIYVGEEHGGAGLSRLDAALIFEELATGCTSTAAYLSIHNMVAWMIDAFGTETQRARFLPDLMTMQRLASYCLTEPGAGSDAGEPRDPRRTVRRRLCRQRQQGIHLRRRRERPLRLHGADRRPWPGRHQLPAGRARAKGLSFGQQEKKLGWHSQPTATVILEDCRVPEEQRIGAEGDGFKIAMQGLDGGRVNIAACALGAARACYQRARAHLLERRQFGRRLAEFQALQFRLADMATELAAARLMVWRAAAALDRGESDATLACAMAKRFATDVAFQVCNDALQLHGGYGYIKEYEIERYLRDVRVHQILEGTNEIMRLIIARRLLAG